jgi:hypothetical protein
MATTVRNTSPAIRAALVTAHNTMRRDMLRTRGGLVFHADASTPVSLADIVTGSTLAVQVAFVAALSAAYVAHIASACSATTGQGAHISADATNVFTTPAGTDLATCYARVNELKAIFNLHRVSTTFHPVADGTNVIASTDATTAATLATLGVELKTDINAHYVAAFATPALNVVAR